MKKPLHRILLLAFPLAASSFFASCASDHYQSAFRNLPSESGYATHVTLPSDYSGDAYYYNDRYYTGGRYEPGTYTYNGQTYNHRYIHDGQNLYGGEYRRQGASGSVVRSSPSTRYVTYRTLPRDHSGDVYYYNNRYYAGGSYEPGTYSYRGRTYDHRYSHDGKYIYGGEYRPAVTSVSTQRTIQRSSPTYRTITR